MDRFDAMALMVPDLNPKLRDQFAAILRQVAHDEREACAQLCYAYAADDNNYAEEQATAAGLGDAIRTRTD